MKLCSHKTTIKDKLKDIAENQKINETLINHYNFILNHYDEIIAAHDKDIAVIEATKAEVLKQFIEAPEKLKELAKSVTQLKQKKDTVTKKTQKIQQVKNLRVRLAALEAECKENGIDLEEALEKLKNEI